MEKAEEEDEDEKDDEEKDDDGGKEPNIKESAKRWWLNIKHQKGCGGGGTSTQPPSSPSPQCHLECCFPFRNPTSSVHDWRHDAAANQHVQVVHHLKHTHTKETRVRVGVVANDDAESDIESMSERASEPDESN